MLFAELSKKLDDICRLRPGQGGYGVCPKKLQAQMQEYKAGFGRVVDARRRMENAFGDWKKAARILVATSAEIKEKDHRPGGP